MAYRYQDVYEYIKDSGCKLLTLEDDYKIIETILDIECRVCECVFQQSFRGFRDSIHKTCRDCRYIFSGKTRAKTTQQFKQEVFSLNGSEYVVVGDYVNANTKIKLKHARCGCEYYVLPRAFLEQGHRCPSCNPKRHKTHQEFVDELSELVGDEYTVLGEYKNSISKLDVQHNVCGYLWSVTPNNILTGTRCPSCYRSKGEEAIELSLKNMGISYIKEYEFEDCVYKNVLRFDFYIPNYGALIEYDGIQHFEPCGFGEKDESVVHERFKEIQKRDRIKNEYCKKNSIPLLRIPYWKVDSVDTAISEYITIM